MINSLQNIEYSGEKKTLQPGMQIYFPESIKGKEYDYDPKNPGIWWRTHGNITLKKKMKYRVINTNTKDIPYLDKPSEPYIILSDNNAKYIAVKFTELPSEWVQMHQYPETHPDPPVKIGTLIQVKNRNIIGHHYVSRSDRFSVYGGKENLSSKYSRDSYFTYKVIEIFKPTNGASNNRLLVTLCCSNVKETFIHNNNSNAPDPFHLMVELYPGDYTIVERPAPIKAKSMPSIKTTMSTAFTKTPTSVTSTGKQPQPPPKPQALEKQPTASSHMPAPKTVGTAITRNFPLIHQPLIKQPTAASSPLISPQTKKRKECSKSLSNTCKKSSTSQEYKNMYCKPCL